MGDTINTLRVGQTIPDFKLQTHEAAKGDFSEIGLTSQKVEKTRTVLFFYPLSSRL